MTETPVVIADVQRSGPSTGMPTKQEQSDLLQMVHGSHGESPRIVISPSSVAEAFVDGAEAFNLAERYQCPVIVASDLSLGLWRQTVERSDLDLGLVHVDRGSVADPAAVEAMGRDVFRRYLLTENGLSPRSLPGMKNGQFLATGAEHGENGKVSEDPKNRVRMMEKRFRKLEHFDREPLRHEGALDGELVLLAIGSTVGICREAAGILVRGGHRVGLLWLRTLAPFPTEAVRKALAAAGQVLVVEQNATGQLMQLMRAYGVGHEERFHSYLKFDGVPFTPQEVAREAAEWLPVEEVVR
jgi:2-oxoglutarate ferredoxin oxidoreductase subunit alpha